MVLGEESYLEANILPAEQSCGDVNRCSWIQLMASVRTEGCRTSRFSEQSSTEVPALQSRCTDHLETSPCIPPHTSSSIEYLDYTTPQPTSQPLISPPHLNSFICIISRGQNSIRNCLARLRPVRIVPGSPTPPRDQVSLSRPTGSAWPRRFATVRTWHWIRSDRGARTRQFGLNE